MRVRELELRKDVVATTDLSDTGVADEEKFEEIVVFTRMHYVWYGRERREDWCSCERLRQQPKKATMLCTWPAVLAMRLVTARLSLPSPAADSVPGCAAEGSL